MQAIWGWSNRLRAYDGVYALAKALPGGYRLVIVDNPWETPKQASTGVCHSLPCPAWLAPGGPDAPRASRPCTLPASEQFSGRWRDLISAPAEPDVLIVDQAAMDELTGRLDLLPQVSALSRRRAC